MNHLVIQGAFYIKGDIVLVPHFTGEYSIVDCDEYKTKKQIKSEYSKEDYKRITQESYCTYDGETYYSTGDYSPYGTEGMELLSDLSKLSHIENDYNF